MYQVIGCLFLELVLVVTLPAMDFLEDQQMQRMIVAEISTQPI